MPLRQDVSREHGKACLVVGGEHPPAEVETQEQGADRKQERQWASLADRPPITPDARLGGPPDGAAAHGARNPGVARRVAQRPHVQRAVGR
ncbi:MAG: hypothetical protein DME09_13120 [Candidatus Rokuibacteriota bacterium]|nr:MAG: hypothetical protein DME09_13120 [Candidatus Rokubacteria bacterium]